MKTSLNKWLDVWGYTNAPNSLHLSSETIPPHHPYRSEIADLLNPVGDFKAQAVFDVDGVPTVCFLSCDDQTANQKVMLRAIRERAWNQNLISIVLSIQDDQAFALPAVQVHTQPIKIDIDDASDFGEFSISDVQSNEVFNRYPDWFESSTRVDRMLLANLEKIVKELCCEGIHKHNAQLLMAQVMFVSYLEHRGIAGDLYREKHQLKTIYDLVGEGNRKGIVNLLEQLKTDFNGDVLEPIGSKTVWSDLSDDALKLLHDFLSRVDLQTGQKDFWRYDFRYIPVELISGIYESFLSDEKRESGAYYTPRNLAVLAVDQALRASSDILAERIYDGACGSGILLTTAYRRLLAHAECVGRRQLNFSERITLLQRSIFGSDINHSACRVTAFSLYLSVLENLNPSDLVKLTDEGKCKLPKLAGSNIFSGEEGDFFSHANPLAESKRFTLFLSNPPWVEPKGDVELTADTWATERNVPVPRRQLCASFMWRALDAVAPNGRMCFILPVSLFAAKTSHSFVQAWSEACRIETIINFGDIRKLLFDNAKQPTLLVLAVPREAEDDTKSFTNEIFDYWTPKADISLAFGRLTLHSTDRHKIGRNQLQHDNSILTNLYWGTPLDLSLMGRLRRKGVVGNLLEKDGWKTAKGFHKKDSHVSAEDLVSTESLEKLPYLNARAFNTIGPFLDEDSLESFPSDIKSVPNLNAELMQNFKGSRIVFKDGLSPERQICVGFSKIPFSFNSSTAALIAPEADSDVLLFLAIVLQSDLIRYVMLLSAYQVSFERERVSLFDIKQLPFIHPDNHQNPQYAWGVIKKIREMVDEMPLGEFLTSPDSYSYLKREFENLISQYFNLSAVEVKRVSEVISNILPSVQPSSVRDLQTPLQKRVTDEQIANYGEALVTELINWRDAMNGAGNFGLEISASSANRFGALGILKLNLISSDTGYVQAHHSDTAVIELIKYLRDQEMVPTKLREDIYLSTDIVIQVENSIYLVKPLINRLWLIGEAMRDAERIVRFIQSRH